MKLIQKSIVVGLLSGVCATAATAQSSLETYVRPNETAQRLDIGWRADNGGNLEMYSKTAAGREGQFKFIYGGGEDLGSVTFTHFNGSAPGSAGRFVDKVTIDVDGTISTLGDIYTRGTVNATSIVVADAATLFPDYVFEDDYALMPIEEMKAFIKSNGHLPGLPTAEQVAANGFDLGQTSLKTLEKVEELALYVIQLKEENDGLRAEIDQIKNASSINPTRQ